MRKSISFVMIVIILAGTLWLSVENATAAGTITYRGARFIWGKGIVFVFEASGIQNSDVKNANLEVGSNSYPVHCTVKKKEGKIICVARGGLTRYAGETGTLTLAGHTFYVRIPAKPRLNFGNGTISCPPGTRPGADVDFFLPLDGPYTEFVPGSTLAEVQQNADGVAANMEATITGVGNLYCHQ